MGDSGPLRHYLGSLRNQGQLTERNLVFTLNPEQARRKMEAFQTPGQEFVPLFLVSSAAAGSATRVEFEVSRTELTARIQAPPAREDELENLFSTMFIEAAGPRLADLAMGLLTALRAGSSKITVSCGGRCLEVTRQGQSLRHRAGSDGWEVRFHGLPRGGVLDLLQSRCRHAPFPVLVNGERLAPEFRGSFLVVSRSPELPRELDWSAPLEMHHKPYHGLLAVAETGASGLEVVVLGVSHQVPLRWPLAPVRGLLWCDELHRDLSRTALARDGSYRRLLDWVDQSLETVAGELAQRFVAFPEAARERAAPVVSRLAAEHRQRGRLGQAAEIYERLVAAGDPNASRSLAGLRLFLGQPAEARQLLGQRLDETLAAALAADGLWDEAEQCLEQTEIWEKKVFDSDASGWRLADCLLARARLALARHQTPAAERYCKRAMARTVDALGPDSVRVVPIMSALTEVYLAQGRTEEAEVLADQCLQQATRALGKDALEAGLGACLTASTRLAAGHPQQAEQLCIGAEQVFREHFGEEHPELSGPLALRGLALARSGFSEEAGTVLERAIGLRRACFPCGHPEIAQLVLELARLHLACGRAQQALSLAEEALAGRAPPLARARLLDLKGLAMAELGETSAGLASLHQAWELLLEDPFGEEGLTVAYNWWVRDDSAPTRAALRHPQRRLGEEHLEAARVAAHRARLYRLQAQLDQAQEWAGRARAYRLTRATARISPQPRFRAIGKGDILELVTELWAPGRVLNAVSLCSSQGDTSRSDGGTGVLLVMQGSGPINRTMSGPGLAMESEPCRLVVCAQGKIPPQVQALPFALEFHFSDGPGLRLGIRV